MVCTAQNKVGNRVFSKYTKAVHSGLKTYWELDMTAMHKFSLAITNGFPDVEVNTDLVYMAINSFGDRVPFHTQTGEIIRGNNEHKVNGDFGWWYGISANKNTGFFFASCTGTALYCVPNWRGFYTCMLVEHSGRKSFYRNEILEAGGISLPAHQNSSIFEKYY